MKMDRIKQIADTAARKATTKLRENLAEVGGQILNDQAEWLDAVMKDLLPPKLYDLGRRGEGDDQIKAFCEKNQIKIIHVADSMAIRIMIGARMHSQFLPKFTVDGEEVNLRGGLGQDPASN